MIGDSLRALEDEQQSKQWGICGYGAAASVKRGLQPYRGHEKFYFSDPTSDITSNRPLAATEDKTATTATAVHRRTRV